MDKAIKSIACYPVAGWRTWKSRRALLAEGSVAMLHTGRCGSTVLAGMLSKHSEIAWDSEVFERYHRNHGIPEKFFTKDPFSVLRTRIYGAHDQIYGFETKIHRLQHLSPQVVNMHINDYVERLRKLNFQRFIVLQRKNYLRQVVSVAVGRRRGSWHRKSGESNKRIGIVLDLNRTPLSAGNLPLIQRFKEFETLYSNVRSILSKSETLWLYYEDDILANPNCAYEQVCGFMGIKAEPICSNLQRTNPYPLKDIIDNYDEVASAITPHGYGWMLDT